MIINPSDYLTLCGAVLTREHVTLAYADTHGVVSIRRVRVYAIEHCRNGVLVARVYDEQRKAPRTFRLTGIMQVEYGNRNVDITF
jgi:predicted DNA-binding transcriptional regulator YafY